jgi:hypothetical protein
MREVQFGSDAARLILGIAAVFVWPPPGFLKMLFTERNTPRLRGSVARDPDPNKRIMLLDE